MPTSPCDWTLTGSICDPNWDSYSDSLKAQSVRFATYVMWAATGRQFDSCEMTVYPCGRDCAGDAWGYWWSDGAFVPYIFNGQWFNMVCGCDGFGCWACRPKGAAYLPGPVQSVVSVIIDGATIDPSEYRVWDQQWLTRLHPDPLPAGESYPHWPACQDYNAEQMKFQVTYIRGTPIPQVVLDAASILASEYAKACQGLECQLPSRVINVARDGVTVSLQDVDELLRSGLTGITSVDQIIVQVNPNRLRGRTRLYSPDVQVARVIT